jgi:hypothetical protein
MIDEDDDIILNESPRSQSTSNMNLTSTGRFYIEVLSAGINYSETSVA